MENNVFPPDIDLKEDTLVDGQIASQVICFDADGKAESIKLLI